MRGGDLTPHQMHPGTENAETAPQFHMVAEHRLPADHQPPQEGATTIHPSSPAASSSLGYSASQYSISFLPLQHLEHPDPHELPDELWTSPSSSSGGGPPEASDEQLDRLCDPHPRSHQELRATSSVHQLTYQPAIASSSGSASSAVPSGSTAMQTSTTLAIRPIGPSLTPTTKSRGRTTQSSSSSQLCPGQQPLSSTSSSLLNTTPSTSSAVALPLHHETYLQHGGARHPQPMEIDSPLSIERSSPSSFISWQDSSSAEQHHLARYPGFWSQDGYQGFWGHPPPMPIQHRRDHPYGDRAAQHRQQPPREDRHQTSHQQPYQRPTLETIREEHQPIPHRERGQRQHSDRSWHHREHQQDQRWQNQDTWHGWYYRPRQQPSEPDLASQRPIGAGREWDSYILQRQQHQLSLERSSSSRTSASAWARQQDGGHRIRIHLNIFHLEASWHVATWSSSTTKMNAIILSGDPVDHHDLIPDILSQSITYILNINRPRVELRSHLAAALHAVPPGVAHQSQNNIRVALHHLDQQPSPRRHHQELIQYLRYHIREHRAFVGHAAFTIEDTYTLLATACQCYIEQLPAAAIN